MQMGSDGKRAIVSKGKQEVGMNQAEPRLLMPKALSEAPCAPQPDTVQPREEIMQNVTK